MLRVNKSRSSCEFCFACDPVSCRVSLEAGSQMFHALCRDALGVCLCVCVLEEALKRTMFFLEAGERDVGGGGRHVWPGRAALG